MIKGFESGNPALHFIVLLVVVYAWVIVSASFHVATRNRMGAAKKKRYENGIAIGAALVGLLTFFL